MLKDFNLKLESSLASTVRNVHIKDNKIGSPKIIFLVRIRRFFLTSDTIDILSLLYSNFCMKNMLSKDRKSTYTVYRYYFSL